MARELQVWEWFWDAAADRAVLVPCWDYDIDELNECGTEEFETAREEQEFYAGMNWM